jgi:MFS family permease
MNKSISGIEGRTLPQIVLAMHFLVLMAFSSLSAFNLLPLFLESIGGSPGEIGLIVGAFSIAAFLSRPLAGWILGRVSPKKACAIGLGLMLIASILYVFVEKIDGGIYFIRTLHGLGFSVFVLAAMLVTILAVPEKTRTYAIGVVSTGFLLPLLVVPYIAEVIIQRYGFLYFFLTAGVLVAIPLVSIFFIRSPIPQVDHEPGSRKAGFFRFLTRKKILIIFSLAFIFEVGLGSCLSFVPLLAHEGTVMRAGYFYTFLGLTAVFLRIFGGKYITFWGDPRLLFPAFCFLAGGALLLHFSRDHLLLALSGMVWGIGTGVLYPHLSALAIEGTPSHEKSMILSLFAASVDLGFAFGPIIFGWMAQIYGVRVSFIPLAMIVFVPAFVLTLFGKSVFYKTSRGESGPPDKD